MVGLTKTNDSDRTVKKMNSYRSSGPPKKKQKHCFSVSRSNEYSDISSIHLVLQSSH